MIWLNEGTLEPEKIEKIVWDLRNTEPPAALWLTSSRPCLLKGQEDNLNDFIVEDLGMPILTLPYKKGIIILGPETLAFGLKTHKNNLKGKIKKDILKTISESYLIEDILIKDKIKLPIVSTLTEKGHFYMGILTFSIDKKIFKKFRSILALCSYYNDNGGIITDPEKITIGLNELGAELDKKLVLEKIKEKIKENG